jgi:hypothetical protein
VQPVGEEGGRADLASHADAVACDQLVAEEADHSCSGDSPEMVDLLWMEQSVDGLIGGEQGDHGDDEQATEVLGSPITVGVTLVCRAPGQPECHQQRHRRQRVGHVVQSVTKQCHRTRQRHHDGL